MTRRMCVNCGSLGNGVLPPCGSCGYAPQTGWEIWYATSFSEWRLGLAALGQAADRFPQGTVCSGALLQPGRVDLADFHLAMDNPAGRDLLELGRGAKSHWFARQANFHIIGPEGYRHRIVRRGKDVSRAAYDEATRKHALDVFLIALDPDDDTDSRFLPKHLWYALKDYFHLLERPATSGTNRFLTLNARHHTCRYLSDRGMRVPA